jgi:hypothetical protein
MLRPPRASPWLPGRLEGFPGLPVGHQVAGAGRHGPRIGPARQLTGGAGAHHLGLAGREPDGLGLARRPAEAPPPPRLPPAAFLPLDLGPAALWSEDLADLRFLD